MRTSITVFLNFATKISLSYNMEKYCRHTWRELATHKLRNTAVDERYIQDLSNKSDSSFKPLNLKNQVWTSIG